jgi:hypothetical protein
MRTREIEAEMDNNMCRVTSVYGLVSWSKTQQELGSKRAAPCYGEAALLWSCVPTRLVVWCHSKMEQFMMPRQAIVGTLVSCSQQG